MGGIKLPTLVTVAVMVTVWPNWACVAGLFVLVLTEICVTV
jgi:hypothetical protein